MTVIGYARGSTREQNPTAQEAELRAAGAERVFVDHGESSRAADRPQWLACRDYLRGGDTLVFRALDRLAASEPPLVFGADAAVRSRYDARISTPNARNDSKRRSR